MAERRRGLAVWIATSGGAGYFPVAPGTAGSLVGLVVVAALGRLPLAPPALSGVLAAATVLLFFLGVWAAKRGEEYFGRVDPGQVVIDEVLGQMVTFLAWPRATWPWLLAGFVAFRAFDIVKPFPARRAERFPHGWGIMTDDLVAGLYSLATVMLLRFVLR